MQEENNEDVWRAVRASLMLVASVALVHPGRFAPISYRMVATEDILGQLARQQQQEAMTATTGCPVDMTALERYQHNHTLFRQDVPPAHFTEEVPFARARGIAPGGSWEPPDGCVSPYRSVVVVPYRRRADHLARFLRLMHAFIQGQNVSYVMLIVEQHEGGPFNRAKLFNVGYAEAMASGIADLSTCFIFHDVDQVSCSIGPYSCVTNSVSCSNVLASDLREPRIYLCFRSPWTDETSTPVPSPIPDTCPRTWTSSGTT